MVTNIVNIYGICGFFTYFCIKIIFYINKMKLPKDFIVEIESLMGAEEAGELFHALDNPSPVSVRFNRAKIEAVAFDGVETDGVPWCVSGLYLDKRPEFITDPRWHAGAYYVQEASSMFLERVLEGYVRESSVMVDLCAAPGGKSTLASSVLPEGSLLISNEVMKQRSRVLAENMARHGNVDVVVTSADPQAFGRMKNIADVLLADVPCSGEGMFRKDQGAIDDWSLGNVDICYKRQRRIIADAWDALKPGGLLIYSTCTYNTLENEGNVRWICEELGADVLHVPVADEWNITGNLLDGESFPVYRFLPHKTYGEGLFMAVMRKAGEVVTTSAGRSKRLKKSKKCGGSAVPSIVKNWLVDAGEFDFSEDNGLVRAIRKIHKPVINLVSSEAYILSAGVKVGEIKGRDVLPSPELALSTSLLRGAFPEVELDEAAAVDYLRREAIVLPAGSPRAVVLLTYGGLPLGFVKNLGNRSNNMYKAEWRIRFK